MRAGAVTGDTASGREERDWRLCPQGNTVSWFDY